MSTEYALSRVKDALEQADGNHLKAYRILTEWLAKDSSLLVGLAAPHLKSIVTHAISYVDQPVKDEVKQQIDKENIDVGELGEALMGGIASGAKFGSSQAPAARQASQEHADTMKSIFGEKKED